jgi:hypothetical protein
LRVVGGCGKSYDGSVPAGGQGRRSWIDRITTADLVLVAGDPADGVPDARCGAEADAADQEHGQHRRYGGNTWL